METYRSGHNGAHSKCVCWATGTRVRISPSPPRKAKGNPDSVLAANATAEEVGISFCFSATSGATSNPDSVLGLRLRKQSGV